MRNRGRRTPGLARLIGSVLIVVLPLGIAAEWHQRALPQTTPLAFALVFFFVALGAQVGLIVRRWGKIKIWRMLVDLLLALIAGVISFAVVAVSVHRGGGFVGPGIIAVITAYVLTVWSGQ